MAILVSLREALPTPMDILAAMREPLEVISVPPLGPMSALVAVLVPLAVTIGLPGEPMLTLRAFRPQQLGPLVATVGSPLEPRHALMVDFRPPFEFPRISFVMLEPAPTLELIFAPLLEPPMIISLSLREARPALRGTVVVLQEPWKVIFTLPLELMPALMVASAPLLAILEPLGKPMLTLRAFPVLQLEWPMVVLGPLLEPMCALMIGPAPPLEPPMISLVSELALRESALSLQITRRISDRSMYIL